MLDVFQRSKIEVEWYNTPPVLYPFEVIENHGMHFIGTHTWPVFTIITQHRCKREIENQPQNTHKQN